MKSVLSSSGVTSRLVMERTGVPIPRAHHFQRQKRYDSRQGEKL